MKRIQYKFFIIIFIIIILNFCLGYVIYAPDSYYIFQWGLSNDGRAVVDLERINNNYAPEILDINEASSMLRRSGNMENTNSSFYMSAKKDVDISFEKARQIFETSLKNEVIIAIIDSGIDINHYEIADNMWTNVKEIPNNGLDDDNNGFVDDIHGYNFCDENYNVFNSYDEDFHATHHAGTIVAKHTNTGIKGIAYDSGNHIKLMSLKILGPDLKGKISNLCRAIEYAHNNGAFICNISLGSLEDNEILNNLIKSYDDMLFVVAAGNGINFQGQDISIEKVYPASYNYENIISVSNLAFNGDAFTSANYGMDVDLFAPGTYILSTLPNNNFGFLTGSSMSVPFVSAVCSMLKSIDSSLTPKQIRNIIINTTTKVPELTNKCLSGGYLNAYEALKSIKE